MSRLNVEDAISKAIVSAIHPYECGRIHAHGVSQAWVGAIQEAARQVLRPRQRPFVELHLVPIQDESGIPWPTLIEPYALVEVPDKASPQVQLAYLYALLADRDDVERVNANVKAFLKSVSQLEFRSGNDCLTIDVAAAQICTDGVSLKDASSIQLPGGEVYLNFEPEAVEGVAVLEWFHQGKPVLISSKVRRGEIIAVDVGVAEVRKKLLGRYVSELGIGTNPYAVALPSGCLFEKVRSSFHVGLDAADSDDHGDLPLVMRCDAFSSVI